VDAIAQGRQGAFARLYDSRSSIVYGMARHLVREPSAAEEITLDAFLQVWRTASTYSPARGSVVSWLVTLTRSRAVDWLRSRQSRFA
jgi:RNA polymerase sigma-70 factor (ECF subfamily)